VVSQAITVDVLGSPTSPDLAQAFTQATARQPAAAGEDAAVHPNHTVRREHTA
jgi:hypothetical protein